MGEYAEMMLDGTCCASCGEFLDTGNGYPTLCAACQQDQDKAEAAMPSFCKPVGCPDCERRFRTHDAYLDHWRAKHDRKATP